MKLIPPHNNPIKLNIARTLLACAALCGMLADTTKACTGIEEIHAALAKATVVGVVEEEFLDSGIGRK